MSALSDAVRNGPRATNAKTSHIEAQIRAHEARAKQAQDAAAAHRRRATGDGPLAKSRRIRAEAQATVADRHRAKANELRTDLAKAKADEAARHVKNVKRTVASTADEGLTPQIPGQGGRAKPGQAKKGGQVAKPKPRPVSPRQEAIQGFHKAAQRSAEIGDPPGTHLMARCSHQCDRHKGHDGDHRRQPGANPTTAPTKGTPAMTAVSGEAVNIEQTRANLDQLKGQVADLRGSFEGISGSLASGGLNQLAGSLASADDSLDSVLTQIAAAEKHLSDQEAIAEAAQAAGEMHGDTSFYGA